MFILYDILFYWSYLVFLFLVYFAYRIYKNGFKKSKKTLVYFFIASVFIYSRFIEPNLIILKKTQIDVWFKANIIVLTDLHLWLYKNEDFLKRVVKKVNLQNDIDFVLITWDFTYVMSTDSDFNKLFNPLKDIKFPVYAILWNHDLQYPWPNIKNNLTRVLEKYNIKILKNTIIKHNDINILWFWEFREWLDNVWLLKDFSKNQNLIVIAHTPDTTLKYKYDDIPDITISWHTHWGQIRIPFIYKYFIPCIWDFDEWLYNYKNNKVFVSSGLGEVIYPFRLLIPPVINTLELR